MSNFSVIMFNLLYPVFIVGFICKGYVRERERERVCVKTQGKLKTEVFSRVACE